MYVVPTALSAAQHGCPPVEPRGQCRAQRRGEDAVASRPPGSSTSRASSPEVPKPLVACEPGQGAMTDRRAVAWREAHIAGLGASRHGLAGRHSPEDRPEELAAAISAWADRHGLAHP